MKLAVIFSVPMTTSPGFAWRWRSADYKRESAEWFIFYRDCVEDAERNGYKVELGRIEAHDTPQRSNVKRV
ncbi:MAG: hypothetical protein ACXWCX_13500 [Burkholderiales bacterium]